MDVLADGANAAAGILLLTPRDTGIKLQTR
jgi:hypothetical protein